jgi:dynactin complex subunit
MTFHVGQRLSYGGQRCTVRYIGTVAKLKGEWLGVEWDERHRGKHHGEHDGVKYFECRSKHRTVGSFVRPNRIQDTPITVALRISGKDIEEVGFDKIRQQMSNLHELQIVVLDKLCIRGASGDDGEKLASICPNIRELDLSRNLFEDVFEALEICVGLEKLEVLTIDGNRFSASSVWPPNTDGSKPFSTLRKLSMNNTVLNMDDVSTLQKFAITDTDG